MELIYLCIYFFQILRQDLDNHLRDFMQQHLLLLLNESVENKIKIDDLSTKNQLLANQLKNDSVDNKKRVDKVFTENQLLRKDSAEHKKRIDEMFTENQRLNQQLKETKADLNLFKENDEKTSDEQMISKLLDQCVTDVCNDFNKILMERYNDYLQKGNQIASRNINNSLFRKFCSFEEISTEADVQKVIDQFSKEIQKTNLVDDFMQDEMLHVYKQNHRVYFKKMKIILPSSFWKDANEKMKRCVEICCNFEHMKQGMKLANYMETSRILLEKYSSVLEDGKQSLRLNEYYYYQITLASLPFTRSILTNKRGISGFELTVTFSALNNVISFSFKKNVHSRAYFESHSLLVDAAGHQLNLKCVVQFQKYMCEQSINELKDMGYIINDGFVLRIQ